MRKHLRRIAFRKKGVRVMSNSLAGIVTLIYTLVVLVLLYMTYAMSGKLAPRRKEPSKDNLYSCGEEPTPFAVPRTFTLTYFKYILIFSLFDVVPILVILSVSLIHPLSIMEYLLVSLYILVSAMAAIIIVR